MAWTRDDIIEWVRARLDELNPTGASEAIEEEVIGREVDQAAIQLLRQAPANIVYAASEQWNNKTVLMAKLEDEPHSFIYPLPSVETTGAKPFLRFIRIGAAGWLHDIDVLIMPDSPLYQAQFLHPFLKATTNKPIVALIPFQFTRRINDEDVACHEALQLFPATGSYDTVSSGNEFDQADALGMTLYENGSDSRVLRNAILVFARAAEDMPETMMDAVVWAGASRVFSLSRKPDLAALAWKNAVNSLTGQNVGTADEERKQ